ncbi:ATP-binding protein, partial [Priestia megaterium]|nr:ATP-binding protein [Priestia megaterium]
RIEMITDEFMSVAKPQAVTFQSIDLQLLIQQVILLLQPQATMKNIFIELNSYGEMPFVYCESNQMKQVFINILKNAIEAMPSGGEIKVELRKKDNNHIHIQIIDEGVGISKERIKHLGEPFYSIKEDGIGLGLMICFNIIQQHKGTLSIESEVNKGTSVEICLPLD